MIAPLAPVERTKGQPFGEDCRYRIDRVRVGAEEHFELYDAEAMRTFDRRAPMVASGTLAECLAATGAEVVSVSEARP